MNSNPEGMIYPCAYDTPSGLFFYSRKIYNHLTPSGSTSLHQLRL